MFFQIPHASNAEEASASIEAMLLQEEHGYRTEDYMMQAEPEITVSRGPQEAPVDFECRSKMSEWCYQVVDFCKFSRETVAIAMSYLDRFLMTESGREALQDRKIFQLAAMTSLYTAIKIHEPEAMEPKVVASLSRGTYREDQVTDMERKIIMAIGWRMNPPTAMSFVQHFMAFMPEGSISQNETEKMIDVARFQTELAVNAYEFVGVKASTVAFAAVGNALQGVDIHPSIEREFLETLSKVSNIGSGSEAIVNVQDQLYFAVETATTGRSNSTLRPKTVSKNLGNNSSIHSSPRSVSATN